MTGPVTPSIAGLPKGSIRKVARMGHPILRQPARDLSLAEIGSKEFAQLIADMVETMKEYGGIGLAAPQIHEPLRLAIIGFSEDSSRYPGMGHLPLTAFINPKITVLDLTPQSYWEGCLSVPGLRGLVSRPRKIRVEYLDQAAQPHEIVAEGFLATVFQHELDHLDGVLYIDRLETRLGGTELAFQEEYQKYLVPTPEDSEGELPD